MPSEKQENGYPPYLNLNVSPSSEAFPGEISNIPEKGYG